MLAFDMKDSMIFDTLKVASFNKLGNASGTYNGKTVGMEGFGNL